MTNDRTSPATASAHTPDPWRLQTSDDSDGRIAYRILGRSGNAPIASVEFLDDEATTRANAHLLRAAPQLLAELREAVGIFRSLESTDGVNGGDLAETLEDWIVRRAEPLIVTAQGRPPAPAACKNCGNAHTRSNPWNAESEDLCDACEQARVREIERIAKHHEFHPDECCCQTYLGRACCMAPVHGDLYQAICIENGVRFSVEFRANSLQEAKELGQEHASGWGGECIRVRKLPQTPTS